MGGYGASKFQGCDSYRCLNPACAVTAVHPGMISWKESAAKKLIFRSHTRVCGDFRLSHPYRSHAWHSASEPHRKSKLPGSLSELHSLSFRLWQDDKQHRPLSTSNMVSRWKLLASLEISAELQVFVRFFMHNSPVVPAFSCMTASRIVE